MTTAELIDLFEYNRWAHERIIAAASELSAEQYMRHVEGSMPSLRATLEHLLGAEVVWLSRWEGHSLGDTPDYSECADATALKSRWKSLWNRQFRFLRAVTEDGLSRPIDIRTRSGIETVQTLSETLIHVVNHATYHRGQAASIIRQVGGTPQSTDYFTYCLVRGSVQPETEVVP
ncbi:MAG: DinB family protein [Gemmatimonadales bacterium]